MCHGRLDPASEPPRGGTLATTGRCARIDLAQSRIVLREYPGGHFPEFVGHYFDPLSWDGSDLAVCVRDSLGKASSGRIVTEQFVKLMKANRISNHRTVRLSDVQCGTSIYEIGSQHLLPSDFATRVLDAYRDAGLQPPEGRWSTEPSRP